MKRILFIIFTLFIIVGCGGSDSFSSNEPKEIASYSAKEVDIYINQNIIINHKYTFGYKAYKINYKTTDDNGNSVNASGVMIVPTLDGTNNTSSKRLNELQEKGFSIVVNCHGTIFANKNAPSIEIASLNHPDAVGTLFSSIKGFVTLMPDYIGFGDSRNHYHPYLLKKSSANSVKDFINASIEFANKNGIELNPSRDVYLTGYSQGGYVAMSSIESIEQEAISLKLVIPMAGPYLLEPIGSAIVSSTTISQPAYASNVVYSYAKVYNKDLQKIFNSPYNSQLDELFSGKYTKKEIDNKLTTNTKKLFTNDFLKSYSTSWFRLKLIKNSVVSFNSSPYVDIKMLHCKGDDVVPYKIATSTKDILKTTGANVELITVEDKIKSPNLTHTKCALPSYIIAADIFSKARGY